MFKQPLHRPSNIGLRLFQSIRNKAIQFIRNKIACLKLNNA